MKKTSIIYAVLLIAVACFYLPASAQKLPNKQIAGVWAPANIKIDGRADEWNNTYQAFNTATDMYYTIANDDKNLYLTTYITDETALFYKTMLGGVMILIKNKDQDISIRYPAFAKRPGFAHLAKGDVLTGKDDDPIITKDNAVFTDNAKTIEVIGINGVENSISIYNESGITAAARFDAKQGYVYELAIPLKYLAGAINAQSTFSYQIFLSGGNGKYTRKIPTIGGGTNADGTPISDAQIAADNLRVQTILYAKYATTDFTGEYTLAKKP